MTANGWAVLAAGVVATGFWLLGYPAAAAIIGPAAMLLLVAGGWRVRAAGVGRVRVTVTPVRVHRGATAVARVEADEVAVDATVDVVGQVRRFTVEPDRPIEWPVTATRRGRFRSGAVDGERTGPLGLARCRIADDAPSATVVLPRLLPFAAPPPVTSMDEDGPASTVRGGAVFSNLRGYVDGDDIRTVHWAASARTVDGSLLVRQHVAARTTALRLVLVPDADGERFETSVDIAYSLAVSFARSAGTRPTLVTVLDGRVVTASGRAAIEEVLLDVEPCGDRHEGRSCLPVLLRTRSGPAGATTAIVTGGSDLPAATAGRTVALRVGTVLRTARSGTMTVLDVTDLETAVHAWAAVPG